MIPIQIVVMEDVRLSKEPEDGKVKLGSFCSAHKTSAMQPRIILDNGSHTDGQERNLQEFVSLEPFNLDLVYQSRRSGGYKPVIQIQLVQKRPETLETVMTRVSIAGRLFIHIFEADNNLTQRFVFDNLDAYGRKVYGRTLVKVEVGYQYKLCPSRVWEVRNSELHAAVPHSSNIGGWNLDIHHRYSPRDNIVYKGDGSIIDLKAKEKIVVALNENFTRTVIGPTALVVDGQGTLFIGDSSHIVRIDSFGRATNLLKLNESTTMSRYFLALSTNNDHLFLSDPTQKRILKIPATMPSQRTAQDNFELFAGSGEICTVVDKGSCGDGGSATLAKLVYPKGLAVTREDELIFVDGNRVRKVDRFGKISTVAGSQKMASEWKPALCGGDLKVGEANFNWPTDIAVDPVTNEPVLIDQGAIFRITNEGRIVEVLNIECDLGQHQRLSVPTNLAFSVSGNLIVTDDKNLIHRVLDDGSVEEVAGSMSYCKRAANGCLQSDFEETVTVASKARFQRISDVAVGPDDAIYVADLEKHHVRTIRNLLPHFVRREVGRHRESFEVMSPDTKEMYVFDQMGVHLETKGLFASATGYNFLYKSSGSLWMVHDKNMNHVELVRSTAGVVQEVKLSSGQSYRLRINKKKDLQEVRAPNGFVTVFQYEGNTGLIKRVFLDRGKMQYLHKYTDEGHLVSSFSPVARLPNNASSEISGKKQIAEQNALLLELYEVESKINPVTVGFQDEDSVHRIQWEYFVHSQGRSSFGVSVDGIGKRFLINGEMAFKSELHPRSMIQSLYDSEGDMLLKVEKYAVPKRTLMIPRAPFHPVDQTYDEKRRPKKWSWGSLEKTLEYDLRGRIVETTDCLQRSETYRYSYEDDTYPNIRVDQDGNEFHIGLDNSGGLERITTPMRTVHTFSIRADLGSYILEYRPPWTQPIVFSLSDSGLLVERRIKGTSGRTVYKSQPNSLLVIAPGMKLTQEKTFGNILQEATSLNEEISVRSNISFDASKMELSQVVERRGALLSGLSYVCRQEKREHSVNCNFTINGQRDTETRTFQKATNQLLSIRGFDIVRGQQSTSFINSEKEIEYKQEFNGHKNPTKIEIRIGGKKVFSRLMEYFCNQKLSKTSDTVHTRNPRSTTFEYTATGKLKTSQSPTGMTWAYEHDPNGNVVNADFRIGNTSFVYEFNERMSGAGFNKIAYTEQGNMKSRSSYRFEYNGLDQLTHIYFERQLRKEVIYDVLGRPVLLLDHSQSSSTTLVYAQEAKPWLLTHCSNSRTNKLHRFIYNTRGHVIAMMDDAKTYMIATSPTGTPEIVFDENGETMKEVLMSPFGTVLQDSNEDFPTCLGFHGGIDLEEAGVVLITGRPYDSLIGAWMVPDAESVLAFPEKSEDVFLYRFNRNDPVNERNRDNVESLPDWLDFFDLNLKTLARPILDPQSLGSFAQPQAQLKVGHKKNQESAFDTVLDPSVQTSLSFERESRKVSIGRFFQIKSPLLGPNIVLTTEEDGDQTIFIRAFTIDEANPFEKTIAGMLNNTIKLENYRGDEENIYFLKEGGFVEEDIIKLKTRMNIEERSIAPHGREICIRMQEVRYETRFSELPQNETMVDLSPSKNLSQVVWSQWVGVSGS